MTKLNYQSAPTSPGVYIFRGSKNQPLYIGKAVNLRARLKNYFSPQLTDNRLRTMVASATKLDWQITDSDIEALILESQLIKKHKPRFNIMLRDDKQYSYVVVTDEEFPKILVAHRPGADIALPLLRPTSLVSLPSSRAEIAFLLKSVTCPIKDRSLLVKDQFNIGSGTLGPFTDAGALKTTLRLLRNIFPYCTCKQKHNMPCLNYHIGKCLGYCCLKNPKMLQAPRPTGLGHCAPLRSLATNYKLYDRNIKAIVDILSGKKTNLVKQLTGEMNRLAKTGQLEQAITLRNQIEKLKRVFQNAKIVNELEIENKELGDKTLEHLQQLKQTLKLPRLPHRIEVYDISNIQGEHAVGVMVVFTDGQPDKSQYRKFRIQRNAGPASALSSYGLAKGDPAMLAEVLMRRLAHPEWALPDLILVDGGKAQLNAALSALKNASGYKLHDISLIALTKDDKHLGHHIYTDHQNQPVLLKNLSPTVANFLLRLDNEAHRFAINYYRSRHRRDSYN